MRKGCFCRSEIVDGERQHDLLIELSRNKDGKECAETGAVVLCGL